MTHCTNCECTEPKTAEIEIEPNFYTEVCAECQPIYEPQKCEETLVHYDEDYGKDR